MNQQDPDRRRRFAFDIERTLGRMARATGIDPWHFTGLRQPERKPVSHASLQADLLQRHLLCGATNFHDPGPDGRCRDCTIVVTASDPVCAPEVLIHAEPDEAQP